MFKNYLRIKNCMKRLETLVPLAVAAATTLGTAGAIYGASHLPPQFNEGFYWAGLAHGNGYNDSGRPFSEIANLKPMKFNECLDTMKYTLY
jgi:hypothetical protein